MTRRPSTPPPAHSPKTCTHSAWSPEMRPMVRTQRIVQELVQVVAVWLSVQGLQVMGRAAVMHNHMTGEIDR